MRVNENERPDRSRDEEQHGDDRRRAFFLSSAFYSGHCASSRMKRY
jgi:hypothetical protein